MMTTELDRQRQVYVAALERSLDGLVPTCYPNSLPDDIPARVYTRRAADEAVTLAADAVALVRARLRRQSE